MSSENHAMPESRHYNQISDEELKPYPIRTPLSPFWRKLNNYINSALLSELTEYMKCQKDIHDKIPIGWKLCKAYRYLANNSVCSKNIYQHHTPNVHLNNLVKLKTQGILNLISQISKRALNPCQSFWGWSPEDVNNLGRTKSRFFEHLSKLQIWSERWQVKLPTVK